MNKIHRDEIAFEYEGLRVFWIYTAFGPHRGILLQDGRAFYFTTKPAGGRTEEDCIVVGGHEEGFDRTSHLNVFEPLLINEYQTGLPRKFCGVLSEYSSREIIAKIQRYYGEVCFI